MLENASEYHAEFYQVLRDYAEVFRQYNSKVLVKMKFFIALGDKLVKFERFMFNFLALRDGFIKGCRYFMG